MSRSATEPAPPKRTGRGGSRGMSKAELLAIKTSSLATPREPRPTVFACSLRSLREGLNLSVETVARQLGLTRQGVVDVELGRGTNLATALRFAEFYGKSVHDIWQLLPEKGE